MNTSKECKECPKLHNAGRRNPDKHLQKYNAWCCKYGKPAKEAISHCKIERKKNELN